MGNNSSCNARRCIIKTTMKPLSKKRYHYIQIAKNKGKRREEYERTRSENTGPEKSYQARV